MKRILIVMGRYLPGYKDGGPVRTIKNLVDRLGDEYDFRILTVDRDHGDAEPYPDIEYHRWNRVGKAKVGYVPPGSFQKNLVEKLAKHADVVYVCGCFNDYARVVLLLKKQGKIAGRVIVASMGLFSPGAFHIKYPKKKLYMTLLRTNGYLKNIEWSATSEEEVRDIRREADKKAVCHIAEDLPRQAKNITHENSSDQGKLRIIFLSRISRKKNLTFAADILRHVKGDITFDIYGNMEDPAYWQECEEKLKELPENIKWKYCGEADAEQVIETFAGYDVFLFPTLAENYGHVILEALSAGCIPIISDKTSWSEEKMRGTGCVCRLEEEQSFIETVQKYADMEKWEAISLADKAKLFAVGYLQGNASESENAYRKMFSIKGCSGE